MKKLAKIALYAVAVFAMSFMVNTTVNAADDYNPNRVYINQAENAKGQTINVMKQVIATDVPSQIAYVSCGNGCKIVNLKSNNKALSVSVTSQHSESATITGYATKANKGAKSYTVSFGVVDSNGASKGNYSVKVQARDAGYINTDSYSYNSDYYEYGQVAPIFKSVKYGKQTVSSTSTTRKKGATTVSSQGMNKISKKSGKLKITPNSYYKITGMVVCTVGKNGKYSYKKVKNGKTITASKKIEYSSKSANGSFSKEAKKYTYICVSYKDKFTGTKVKYSISKQLGTKRVKRVYTNGLTGRSSISLNQTPSDITLWSY